MKALIAFLIFTFSLQGLAARFEFPEDREYGQADQGLEAYIPKSMFGTQELVLTFDDGPDVNLTPKILDILAKYNVKATFFLVGQNITSKSLPIVERMFREGHLVGAHSWSHTDERKVTEAQFRADFEKTIRLVKQIQARETPGANETYWRFPYGDYGFQNGFHHMNVIQDISQKWFGENCINFAFWTMDAADYVADITPEDILQNVKSRFEGGDAYTYQWVISNGKKILRKKKIEVIDPPQGGVVLMHDVQAKEVKALPMVLDYALKAGIKIVPLNTVQEYSYAGKTCQPKTPF